MAALYPLAIFLVLAIGAAGENTCLGDKDSCTIDADNIEDNPTLNLLQVALSVDPVTVQDPVVASASDPISALQNGTDLGNGVVVFNDADDDDSDLEEIEDGDNDLEVFTLIHQDEDDDENMSALSESSHRSRANMSDHMGLHQKRGRRRKLQQCIKNDSGASFTLKVFYQDARKYSNSNFMYGQTYCRTSAHEDRPHYFRLKPNACDVAAGFAKAAIISAACILVVVGSVATAGIGNIVAGAVAGAVSASMSGAAIDAMFDKLPEDGANSKVDGLIPCNMKEGASESVITGSCLGSGLKINRRRAKLSGDR
jgi:hypothetical protein